MTVYIVEDDFGKVGRGYRETEVGFEDLETTIQDLITRQYNDPIRAVSFNTAERWSAEISEDIAQEIQRRHDIMGEPVPSHLADFVASHTIHAHKLALRLRPVWPVRPAKGQGIVTLSDARAYVLTLPKDKQEDRHVLAGVQALAADGQVPDLVAQFAVAHIVHWPPKVTPYGKRERPWMKRNHGYDR